MKQQELYHQYMGKGSKQVRNLRNITQLPHGQHVVPTTEHGEAGSRRFIRFCRRICSGMGVPKSDDRRFFVQE